MPGIGVPFSNLQKKQSVLLEKIRCLENENEKMKGKQAKDKKKIKTLKKDLDKFYKQKQNEKKREEEERKKRENEEREKEEREKIEEQIKREEEKRKQREYDLFEASADGKLSSVIELLENGTNVNSKDPLNNEWHNHNSTALHYAAREGHLSVVEYLVNQKADINAKNTDVEFLYLIGLLFIGLLIKIILVFLNIWLIKGVI